jgi:hypothetical protein
LQIERLPAPASAPVPLAGQAQQLRSMVDELMGLLGTGQREAGSEALADF